MSARMRSPFSIVDTPLIIPYSGFYTGTYEIGRLTYAQNDPTQLTNANPNALGQPVVSPSGRKIAFRNELGSTYANLWVMNTDGSSLTMIYDSQTHGDAWVETFDWKKDSSGLVLSVFDGGSSEDRSLYTLNVDGTGFATLYTDPSARRIAGPSFSFDGTKIGFHVLLTATSFGVWTVNSDGTGAVQVGTSPTQFSGITFDTPQYAWANTQNRIAYNSGTLAAPTARRVDADGTNNILLGSLPVARQLYWKTWRPDDQYVFYSSGTDLRKFAADGSGNSLVYTPGLMSFSPFFFVFGDRVYVDYNNALYSVLTDGTDALQHTTSGVGPGGNLTLV